MSLLDRQIKKAKENFNYFFAKMIIKILKLLLILMVILLVSEILDNIIIYYITVISVLIIGYNLYKTINFYVYILEDIRNTLPKENIYYIIDYSLIMHNFFRKEENYGK